MKTIPTINANSFEEIQEKIKLVEPYTDWIQIDVADGTFTKNTIWHHADDLVMLDTSLNIEIHLMATDVEDLVEKWLISPVKRFIFHLEAAKDPEFIIEKCKEAGVEPGIAIGPDTPWTQLHPYCDKVKFFQILSVYPGLAGQDFIEDSLEKISKLKEHCPDAVIEVDGGVNKEVAQKIKEAGADVAAAASYIFNSENVEEKIKELELV